MAKPSQPSPEPDDEELWRRVAASVTPLKRRRRAVAEKPPAKKAEAVTKLGAKPQKSASATKAPAKPATKAPPSELAHGRLTDLDKRTGQRLARGKMAIEGRLDLHGLTQAQAHGRLVRFVVAGAAAGKRCLLVITGKGVKPTGETGVLRAAVPRWLNAPELRPLVLAIRHAQPKDGGEGALYVLLKRRRGGDA